MNSALSDLATAIDLADPSRENLRFTFGLACVLRVQHLLEDPRAASGIAALQAYVAGDIDKPTLAATARTVREVARSHRGSNSIDGAAHAAVSATNAVACALEGRALDAASYAAYATVYAYGGYAVSDPSAFATEFSWQVKQLELLSADRGARRP